MAATIVARHRVAAAASVLVLRRTAATAPQPATETVSPRPTKVPAESPDTNHNSTPATAAKTSAVTFVPPAVPSRVGPSPLVTATARTMLARLRRQYDELGGCQLCMEQGSYACLKPEHCEAPPADKQLLDDVRQLYLDTVDLASAREKIEYQYPAQIASTEIGFQSWQSYLATRGFNLADLERTQRHLSKPLSYPLSIAQFLSQRKFPFTELGTEFFDEATLPASNWVELSLLFPKARFELYFIGPEMPPDLDGKKVQHSSNMAMTYMAKLYHQVHDELMVSDKIPDFYVAFNPGLGHKYTRDYWKPTMHYLHESKRPIIITSHSPADALSDLETIEGPNAGLRWYFLLHQMLNPFRSLRPDVHQDDIRDIIWSNHSMMVVTSV